VRQLLLLTLRETAGNRVASLLRWTATVHRWKSRRYKRSLDLCVGWQLCDTQRSLTKPPVNVDSGRTAELEKPAGDDRTTQLPAVEP
jgi:hypothetical protein